MANVVFYGIAVASVGGPLALVTLFLPNTLANFQSSSGLAVLLAAVAFGLPLAAWIGYASRIASPGGLYAYVEVAAGRRVARVHGAIWIVSYFLYLPSTMAFACYDLLPVAFPGITPYRAALEVAIPVVMVAALVLWRLGLYACTAAIALAQVALVGVLAAKEIAARGVPVTTLGVHAPAGSFTETVLLASLLLVCVSLPLYLGGEVRRATVVTARSLLVGVGVGAACAVVGVLALGSYPVSVLGAEVPGWLIGRSLGGVALGDALLLGTTLSVLSLVLLEYVALTRLVYAMSQLAPRRIELGVGVAFVASSALSLLGPDAAYERLVSPALVALYLSLLVVFAVYPGFRRKFATLRVVDVVVAAGACGLMIFALYNTITTSSGF